MRTERVSDRARLAAGFEVLLAAVAVVFDLAVPSVVVLAVMAVSLLARRQGLSSLGLRPLPRPGRTAGTLLVLAAAWTLLNAGLFKPVESHLTGTRQDVSQFDSVRGHLPVLLAWLALAWVVAALGETVAFIGFVQTRLTEVVGRRAVAVLLSSLLLGLLHTEYGLVGVTISAIDGVFYSVLRYRYRSLWAPILAHGFIDSIGLITVFLDGPVQGLW